MAIQTLDRSVTSRAIDGDAEALSCIYETYAEALYRYIYMRVGDADEAEDIRSEVFLRMLEGISTFEDRGIPLSAWLYRVAHDRIVDRLRHRKRHPSVTLESWNGVSDETGLSYSLRKELQADVRHALSLLGDDQRRVIYLRFFAGMTNLEVAGALGKTEKSVKALRHRGLQELSSRLKAA